MKPVRHAPTLLRLLLGALALLFQLSAFGFLLLLACSQLSTQVHSQPSTPNRVLELDGNDSWIELPADLLKDVKNELTVEGWIRWQRLESMSRLFDFGPPGGKSLLVSQMANSTSLAARIDQPGLPEPAFLVVGNVLTTNQWYHLALTISATGTKFYVNGVLAATALSILNLERVRAGPLRLGASNHSDDQQGHRQIDEFRVWSVVRTEEQIRQSMWTKLTGREAGLLGCWTFDAGDATDLTPAQRHGLQHGNPRFPMEAPPLPSALLLPAQIEGLVHRFIKVST